MRNLCDIIKHKGSDTAVFLGCGSSINNITSEQWDKIKQFDTWTTNNWAYHSFVPKFYHLEMRKPNTPGRKLHAQLIRSRMAHEAYDDVIFIINRDRAYLLDVIGKNRKNIYLYKMNKVNAIKKPIIPKYKPSKNPNILTCNLNASFTMVLELLTRFKYKKILFWGVDLHDCRYFWTNKPEYGKVHRQINRDKPDEPHNTAHIRNFVVWFAGRQKKLGCEFFVCHKDTLLYPDFDYFEL
jgi:hypothetical protein